MRLLITLNLDSVLFQCKIVIRVGYVQYTLQLCLKDGLLFYNKHAHYQTGNTPLVLVWKDENCSQYVIETDGKGEIPSQQQSGVQSGNLLRFAIGDAGLSFVDGKLEKADLIYLGKSYRAHAFADSYSKVGKKACMAFIAL